MNITLVRGLVFFILGLPVSFILSALGFTVLGREIVVWELALCAFVIAAVIGIGAAVWKVPL